MQHLEANVHKEIQDSETEQRDPPCTNLFEQRLSLTLVRSSEHSASDAASLLRTSAKLAVAPLSEVVSAAVASAAWRHTPAVIVSLHEIRRRTTSC